MVSVAVLAAVAADAVAIVVWGVAPVSDDDDDDDDDDGGGTEEDEENACTVFS